MSVTGTLHTDILTISSACPVDQHHVFSVLLAVTFSVCQAWTALATTLC